MLNDAVNLPLLPMLPLDTVYPAVAGNWCEIIFGAGAIMALLFALKNWRDSNSPIMLFIFLGGTVTSLMEPYVDILGGCFHPIIGQHTAYELMGRPIPWWVVASYAAYFGGLGMVVYHFFTKGITMRSVFILFCVPVAVDILIEELMMLANLYYYYGQQPLILHKFPAWWGPCNAMGVYILVTVLALLKQHLHGWKLLLIPLTFPVADAIGYTVGLPSMVVVHTTNVSSFVSALAGFATYALTALYLLGIAYVIGVDSPLRKGSKETPWFGAVAST